MFKSVTAVRKSGVGILAAILGMAIWSGPQLRGAEIPITLTDLSSSAQVYSQTDTGIGSWTVNGTNEINRQWFWYSVGTVAANNPAQAINTLNCTLDRPADTYVSGDTLNQEFVKSGQFDITLTYILSGSGSTGSEMTVQFTVTNVGGQALNFHLFQLANFDLGGFPGQDTAQAGVDGQGSYVNIVERDGNTSLSLTANPGANRAQVDVHPVVYDFLTGSTGGNLSDSVGPTGPGNIDSALQWDLNVPANGTSVVTETENLTVYVVPEPATLSLLVLGGLGLLRRKN